jgi:hypothetical protein
MNLNLGIFFDGTGNNILDRPKQTISNVAKLYKVYGKEGDESVDKLYIRGVGSKKHKTDTDLLGGETVISQGLDELMGGAFGSGGHDRINQIIKQAKARLKKRPQVTELTIDVFGFSRGAAMARHFVNIIRRDKLLSKQSIRFLGLFDTVGSFGIPGDNKDDFDFGVSNDYVRYVYQLVAENELRKNFDLQSIRRESSVPYQMNDSCCKGDRWMVEILCPGVHSDIGGGYDKLSPERKRPQHGNDNNLLSRVYLERMFTVARKCDVPFMNPPREDEKEFWQVDKDIKTMLSNILGYYNRQPFLRAAHSILREAEAYLVVEEYRKGHMPKRINGGKRPNPDYTRRKFDIKRLTETGIPALKALFLAEAFKNDNVRRNTFMTRYRTFKNRYMHVSHFPGNRTIGMEAQTSSMGTNSMLWPSTATNPRVAVIKDTLKREIFYNTAS